jgi:hypothetical protein
MTRLQNRLSAVDFQSPGTTDSEDAQLNDEGEAFVFCHLDTWQITMRRLAARSDAVLMDLRSFSPANQGCLYELEQLLGLVPLEDVVLVVDDTTDRPFLAATLQALWQNVPANSPNRGLGANQIRLFQVSSGSPGEVRALLKSLFGAQPQIAEP